MNESKHGYRISVKTKIVVESLVYAVFDIFFSFPRRGAFFKKVSSREVFSNQIKTTFCLMDIIMLIFEERECDGNFM